MEANNYPITTAELPNTAISQLGTWIDEGYAVEIEESWNQGADGHISSLVGIAQLIGGGYWLSCASDTEQASWGGCGMIEYIYNPGTKMFTDLWGGQTHFDRAIVEGPIGGFRHYLARDPYSYPTPLNPGCFIATAAYGSPMAKELDTFRAFRDQYLDTNPVGSRLVKLYYRYSPPVASFIDDHPALRPVARAMLTPPLVMAKVALNTTLPQKVAIVGSTVSIGALLALWFNRRRLARV